MLADLNHSKFFQTNHPHKLMAIRLDNQETCVKVIRNILAENS